MINAPRDSQSARSAPKWAGHRRSRALSLGLAILVILVVTFASVRIAAPHLISSSLVRSAIAASIEEWAGNDVAIEDVTELRFWPKPEVTLTGVTVSRTVAGGRENLIEIERFSAGFSLISAFRGRPDFNDFRLERPRIQIARGLDGRLDWSDEGLLSEAVRAALAGAPVSGEANQPPDPGIGSVDVVDGQVTLTDLGSGTQIVASSINASIEWPTLSAPLSGEATMKVENRPITVSVKTPTPLLLIGGSESQLQLSTTLAGISATFDGVVGLPDGLRSGSIDIRIVDMATGVSSLGVRLAGTERWRKASLKARIANAEDTWRLEDLNFEVNDIRGDGILTLARHDGARPLLSGTLALEHLELGDLLQGLSIELGDRANVPLPSLTRWIDMDLRLSAGTAAFKAFPLADLGASLIGRDDSLKLVIGDTAFLGGTLSARLTGLGEGFNKGAEISVMMDRVDLGALMTRLAIDGPSLKGTGSLTFGASLVGTGWQRNIEAMSGTLKISSDNGEVLGFDAEGLRRLASDRAYFQLSAAGTGSFDYETLDMAIRFSNGSAEVEKGRIAGERETLTLTGIVPYSRRALALAGELSKEPAADNVASPMRFFIAGGWSDPVISPIPSVFSPGQ